MPRTKKIITTTIDEDLHAQLKENHVKISSLINELITAWLETETTETGKLKSELREKEAERASITGKINIIKKRIKEREEKAEMEEYKVRVAEREHNETRYD